MQNSCLIIIDLINDYLDQWDPDAASRLIAHTNELANAFRASDLPIIWVRQEFKADLSDAFPEMRKKNVKVAIEGTEGALLHADLDWHEGDVTIVKKRYSAFFKTELEERLALAGVTEVVLCGINTHACIRMTAIDAYQRDLKVVLARDCIGSYDAEHARVSIAYMDGKIAEVVASADILERVRLIR